MQPHSSSALLCAATLLAACGGPGGPTQGAARGGPPTITAENAPEVTRTYVRMAVDDPARVAWRDALIGHAASRSEALLEAGDYAPVIEHLITLTRLLTPREVSANQIPRALVPVARWVVEHGSPRGDEGRVMAAHRLLAATGEDAEHHRRSRERIARWGRSARARISNPIERYGELIRVWEQHSEIAPAPEVLDALAALYVEQREALRAIFAVGSGGAERAAPAGMSYQQLQLVPLLIRRAPLDVAAVFLRYGDLEGAATHVRQIDATGSEAEEIARLVTILEAARAQNANGAEALGEIAVGFTRARPRVAEALCGLGTRRFPEDPRFPLCLARIAIESEQPGLATSWYAETVRLAPTQRDVYDEALRQLAELMQSGVFGSDIGQSRAIARSALHIIEQHRARWPEEPPEITPDQILLQLGRAEMSAGNVERARARLEASLAANESREAHLSLGLLLERTGRGADAATHYRTALDQTTARGAEDRAQRAELTERLGDAFRTSGRTQQAQRMYRQALQFWDSLLERAQGPQRAMPQVRRGILLSRLGQANRSAEAFAAAIESAPTWREPYAAILAHLVVSAPNLELAQDVLRRAQYQLHLEPEWKVYFALWVQAIAGRATAEPERDVALLLEELARGNEWTNRLAAFGDGSLPYRGLRGHATNSGQRVEADFYEGARRLTTGDQAGARALFQQVLESGMVNFYEFAMAQELLRAIADDGPVAESTPVP